MTGAIIPAFENADDLQVAVPDDVLGLDRRVVERAAGDLGLKRLNLSGLAAAASMGDTVKKLGALKIGRSIVLLSADRALDGVTDCDDFLTVAKDEKQRASVLGVKAQLLKIAVQSGEALIDSASVDQSDDAKPPGAKAPSRGHQVPVIFAQTANVTAPPAQP